MAAPSQFKSNYKGMRLWARHGYKIYHPVTGAEMYDKAVKELLADFAVHRGEYTVVDPITGREERHADIVGFFYDLDVDAAAKGWSDDEKEMMRAHLIRKAETNPDMVQIYSAPSAPLPWPTYDSAPAGKIASLASVLGLVAQALAYERENEARADVIAALEKALPAEPAEPDAIAAKDAPVEELVAAV